MVRMYALKWEDGRLSALYSTEENAISAQYDEQKKGAFLLADAGIEAKPKNPSVVSVLVWEFPHWLNRLLR